MMDGLKSLVGMDEIAASSTYGDDHSLAAALYGVALGHLYRHPGRTLEIGTFLGYSAIFHAAAQIDSGSNCGVLTVDIVERGQFRNFNRQPTNIRNLITSATIPATQAGRDSIDGEFSIVFIDGAHDYDSAKADIRTYIKLLRTNGLLLIHDTWHPPVQTAMREELAGWHISQLHGHGALSMARRESWEAGY